MKQTSTKRLAAPHRPDVRVRKGVITVLAAVLLATIFAFVAFAVDTGLIIMTQTDMQNAVDAAALAASQEITGAVQEAGEGGETIDANSIAVANARLVAEEVAEANGVYIDPDGDVTFGKRTYDEASNTWPIVWGAEPYNIVKVVARRDQSNVTQPDGEIKLAFGWAVGHDSVPVIVSAAAFVEARDIAMVLDYSEEAVDLGYTIHTLSVGANSDRDMMEAIAFIGGGIWIDVPGGSTVSEMEEQVLDAFSQIAAKVPPAKLVYAD